MVSPLKYVCRTTIHFLVAILITVTYIHVALNKKFIFYMTQMKHTGEQQTS